MVFYYILWTFGIVCGNFVYFSCFGILNEEKSGNTALASDLIKIKAPTEGGDTAAENGNVC
jgi:hypothetical protein